jgi:ABC-type cobalamin/Fe3+-siderophores transport system ATPase subunit
MLSRIHIDNFRCLVNFDLKLDRLNLLLGGNGSGKTTVFEVLRRLQQFLAGDINVDAAFPEADLTRWQALPIQQFELEVATGARSYLYELLIEHTPDRRKRRIKRERLTLGGRPLFCFEEGTAQLYHDSFDPGPQYPFDWARSGIGALNPRPDNTLLTRFREEASRFVIVGFWPAAMLAESNQEHRRLSWKCENFVSWYRYLSQEYQGKVIDLVQELRTVLPGFDSFSLRDAGEDVRVLKLLRDVGAALKQTVAFRFDELSDGERILIVLYTLAYGLKGLGYSLFLDEPDNYVCLREIQPWLTALHDACGEGLEQAVLISNHPEVIDYLAGSSGRWFERPDAGPVRVRDEPPATPDGLTASEAIARGWDS